MTTSLEMDLRETLTAFAKYKNISWSKYLQFSQCPGNWFSQNFARFVDVEAARREDSRGIPGTIIQRLFESFINDRIYRRSDMTTMQSLVDWFQINTRALFHLIAFDEQAQYTMQRQRYFFRRREGKQRVADMRNKYNLDVCLYKGIQPNFIDWDFFNVETGGKETFIKKLNALYLPILQDWSEIGIELDKMLSEVWLQGKIYGDINVTGKIDFIYNKYQKGPVPFIDARSLENAFVLMDGKYNISKWVKKEQLFFYAAGLYFRYKKIPTHVSLYNWSKAESKTYKFDLKYVDTLKKNIATMVTKSVALGNYLTELRNKSTERVNILEVPGLEFKAGQKSCTFCPIKKNCPAAKEKGLDNSDILEGIISKRQTTALLEKDGFKPDSKVHEIKI